MYPIDLVYVFYGESTEAKRNDLAYQAHLLRISSYSSRDLDKKGSKQVEDMWGDLIKPLQVSSKKSPMQTEASKKLNTKNNAAHSLMNIGTNTYAVSMKEH